MNEFDKAGFMACVGDFLKLYTSGLKMPMAKVMDDQKLMSPAHAGQVTLASYHLARAYGELSKLYQDWSIINGNEE